MNFCRSVIMLVLQFTISIIITYDIIHNHNLQVVLVYNDGRTEISHNKHIGMMTHHCETFQRRDQFISVKSVTLHRHSMISNVYMVFLCCSNHTAFHVDTSDICDANINDVNLKESNYRRLLSIFAKLRIFIKYDIKIRKFYLDSAYLKLQT